MVGWLELRFIVETYMVADIGRRVVGSHHVWENRDVDDFDYFAINMECQVGHGLFLKAGESMQVIAHMRSIDNLIQIHGRDEWGWSEVTLSSKHYAVMNLGSQRSQQLLWGENNEVQNATKRPYLYGQRAIVAADFGPVPADGYYVLWTGIRTHSFAIQNDWSLNVFMRGFWEVEQVLIRQTPAQRR